MANQRFEVAVAYTQSAQDVHKSSWHEVSASDAEDAARIHAEDFDSARDYTIVRGKPRHFWVRDNDGKITRWEVSGEAEPVYYATEVTTVSASSP